MPTRILVGGGRHRERERARAPSQAGRQRQRHVDEVARPRLDRDGDPPTSGTTRRPVGRPVRRERERVLGAAGVGHLDDVVGRGPLTGGACAGSAPRRRRTPWYSAAAAASRRRRASPAPCRWRVSAGVGDDDVERKLPAVVGAGANRQRLVDGPCGRHRDRVGESPCTRETSPVGPGRLEVRDRRRRSGSSAARRRSPWPPAARSPTPGVTATIGVPVTDVPAGSSVPGVPRLVYVAVAPSVTRDRLARLDVAERRLPGEGEGGVARGERRGPRPGCRRWPRC